MDAAAVVDQITVAGPIADLYPVLVNNGTLLPLSVVYLFFTAARFFPNVIKLRNKLSGMSMIEKNR
jgi:hypothetical protein